MLKLGTPKLFPLVAIAALSVLAPSGAGARTANAGIQANSPLRYVVQTYTFSTTASITGTSISTPTTVAILIGFGFGGAAGYLHGMNSCMVGSGGGGGSAVRPAGSETSAGQTTE